MSETPAAAPSAPAAPSGAAAPPTPSSAPAPSNGAPSASPAAAGDVAKAPAPASPQEFELTIDGKVEKWPLERLLRNAQLGEAQRRRFDEIARARQELEQRQKELEDPDRLLALAREKLGDRWQKLTEEEVIQRYEREQQTPEQQELAKLRQEKLAREKADAERAAKESETKAQEEKRRVGLAYVEKWKTALEKMNVPLGEKATPLTAITIARFARLEKQAAAGGLDAPAEVLGEMVRDEIRSEQRMVTANMDGAALFEHMGEEAAMKLLRYYAPILLKKYAPQSPAPVPTARPEQKRDDAGRYAAGRKSREDRMFDLVVGGG